MAAEQPMSHIRPQRFRFASLQETLPSGLTDDAGVAAANLASFPQAAIYPAGKDIPIIQPRGCLNLDCLPDPCSAAFGYATTIDMHILSGCSRSIPDMDWQKRNVEGMDIAEGDLLARWLWSGIGGTINAVDRTCLPTEQTTILNAGQYAGANTTLEGALAEALAAIDNQSYYGLPVLWAPRALLGVASGKMWDIRGNRVTFCGAPVVGIGGTRLPGPALNEAGQFWVAATGPVEWFIGASRARPLNIDPNACVIDPTMTIEQGAVLEKPALIRMATWPTPQLVEITG